ncbi:MAG: HTTM domain-containing protein [Planctomycetaceae bacterium]|jgi:hypothetical protein
MAEDATDTTRAQPVDLSAGNSLPLRHRLFAPVDSASLVFFRVAFGVLMIWWLCDRIASGKVDHYYVDSAFRVSYYGFGWVRPWPGGGMYLHYYALLACATCLVIGLWYRLSALLFFLGYTYLFLLESIYYNNHYYLISLLSLIMLIVPVHRAWSIDVLLWPQLRTSTAPAWALWLLRAQIAIPYFYGGIAKLNEDWLAGEPMRTWLSDKDFAPHLGAFFRQEAAIMCYSYGGLLFDLAVVPLLLWQRTRLATFVVAVIFHLCNALLFQFSIGIFPWVMIAATLMFFDPPWPRMQFLRHLAPGSQNLRWTPPRRLSMRQEFMLAFLTIYISVQLLVPLRHFLYPGDANWTDEGQRFAWRMMLRSKTVTGDSQVYARYADGRKIPVLPDRKDLGETGRFKLATILANPDLLLQYCHYISQVLRAKSNQKFRIEAHVAVSMNGRKPQRLIDPNVDLAVQPRSLKPAIWIMPLVEPLPTR